VSKGVGENCYQTGVTAESQCWLEKAAEILKELVQRLHRLKKAAESLEAAALRPSKR
jgi:hypothetical protein